MAICGSFYRTDSHMILNFDHSIISKLSCVLHIILFSIYSSVAYTYLPHSHRTEFLGLVQTMETWRNTKRSGPNVYYPCTTPKLQDTLKHTAIYKPKFNQNTIKFA